MIREQLIGGPADRAEQTERARPVVFRPKWPTGRVAGVRALRPIALNQVAGARDHEVKLLRLCQHPSVLPVSPCLRLFSGGPYRQTGFPPVSRRAPR